MTHKTWVTDVCGTLVLDDTTLGLLGFYFSHQSGLRWRYLIFCILAARYSPFRMMVATCERVTGRHLLKHGLVRLLAGQRVCDLRLSAQQYARWLLEVRRVPSVWQLLQPALSERRVVLASASLEPVVAALADAVGAQFVASELEHYEGRLTGRYRRDLTGQKVDALKQLPGPCVLDSAYVAISDNLSDRDLLTSAAWAYVVLHREQHRKRWANLEATFLVIDVE